MPEESMLRNKVIMIVDDDPGICGFMERIFSLEGSKVIVCQTFDGAIEQVEGNEIDIIITDMDLQDPNPTKTGIRLLKEVKKLNKDIMVIILTGYGTIDTAVEAMKEGAFHYAQKPVNLDEIKMIVTRALEHQRLNLENTQLRRSLKKKYKFQNFIGDSEAMQKVFRLIEKVASTDSTVMIQGDNGTGKELVAKAIHYHSERRDRFFTPVNCAAIPHDLIESELFGHVRGGFTGAINDRKGRFETSNGGTLFLDEIGEMPPALQSKMLRAIQYKEVQPVGSDKTIKVDVRLIAATNKNLEKEVKEGRFREDLFYRLNVIPIYLPPLKERVSDLPLLINFFLERFNKEKKKTVKGISREVLNIFDQYDWPGNVRQLENLIERLVILNETGTIDVEDLPEQYLQKNGQSIPLIRVTKEGLNLKHIVNEIEKSIITQAMDMTDQNKNKAAELLQLNRTTLVEKIKRLWPEN